MRKKVVINTSTIRVGGAVQVAVNVIKQSFSEVAYDIYYVTNSTVYNQVNTPIEKTLIVQKYPSSIFAIKVKDSIRSYVKSLEADIVYSVGAPSYVKFHCREVLRLTNPWLIEKEIIAYKKLSLLQQLRTRLEVVVKKMYLKNVDYFITQTTDAKEKIVKNLKKKEKNVKVVQNVYSYNFQSFIEERFLRDYNGIKNILCVSANYPHKNIDLLVEIAFLMRKNEVQDYKFLVTIPFNEWEDSKVKKLIDKYNVQEYFINLGKLNLDELVTVYKKAHIFFLPTLLEVFSVSFLEAMIFEVPIITSNFGFNKCVCKDSAMYLSDPFDAECGKNLIEELSNNTELRNDIIRKGKENVLDLPENRDVYAKHFEVLKQILSN